MSADFDPRMTWTRREALTAAGAGAMLSAGLPGAAHAAADAPLMIVGAGFGATPAQRLAGLLGARLETLPERGDPLRFWMALAAPGMRPGAVLAGVTGWSDYLVLRGAAAERRMRVRFDTRARAAVMDTGPGGAGLAALARGLGDAIAVLPESGKRDWMGWVLA